MHQLACENDFKTMQFIATLLSHCHNVKRNTVTCVSLSVFGDLTLNFKHETVVRHNVTQNCPV